MSKTKKQDEYASKILGKLSELLNDDSSDFFIDQKELLDGDNMTHLIHAVSNLAPTYFYSEMTGNKVNMLDFNHIANKLVIQYINK